MINIVLNIIFDQHYLAFDKKLLEAKMVYNVVLENMVRKCLTGDNSLFLSPIALSHSVFFFIII